MQKTEAGTLNSTVRDNGVEPLPTFGGDGVWTLGKILRVDHLVRESLRRIYLY